MLFRTIPKEEEDALRLRYAGTQAERSSAAKGKKPSDKGMPFTTLNGCVSERQVMHLTALCCTRVEGCSDPIRAWKGGGEYPLQS